MSSYVPESREVREHADRQFDRRDRRLGRATQAVEVAVMLLVLALLLITG